MMDCVHARGLVEAYFVARDPTTLAQVRPLLDGCRSCADAYERMFEAEAALTGGLGLSPTEKEHMLGRVLPPPKAAPSRIAAIIAALTLVTASLAVVWLVPRGNEDEFSARGDGESLPLGEVSLRALCMENVPGGPGPTVYSLTGGEGACPVGAAVTFTVRNAATAARYLQLGIRVGDTVTHLYPPPGTHGEVQPSSDEQPLGATLPLGALDSAQVEIYALFSRQPMSPEALVEQMNAGDSRAPPGATLQRVQVHIEGNPP
jgi:hypothetical protein